MLDRHERVLERRPARVVRVRVAGRNRLDAERVRQVAQSRVPAGVPALVGTLELDEEPVAAEGMRQAGGRVRIADGRALPRAAGEADEPLVQFLQQPLVERRRERLGPLLRPSVRERAS